MAAVLRGLRNLGRNLPRTLLVSLILGLAVALALIVFAVEEGIGAELSEIEVEVGTLIEVRPVDSFGPRVEEPMDLAVLEDIRLIDGVRSITPYLTAQLPLDPEALDNIDPEYVFEGGMGGPGGGGGRGLRRYFAFGIGLDGDDVLLSYGGGTAEILEGRNLNTADNGKTVAVVADNLAAMLNLQVGSTIPFDEEQDAVVEIVGIFSSDSRLLGRGVFMPFDTVTALWGTENELHQVSLIADNIQTVDGVVEQLRSILGEEVDVISYKEIATGHLDERIESMQSVLKVLLYISLALVGVVVLATMILIVRERSSEVGILKALGAYRRDIVSQFGAEALFLGVCGYIWGFFFYFFGGSFIGNMLLNMNGADSAVQERGSGMISRQGFVSSSLSSGTVEASLSFETAVFVFCAVIIMGLAGGIIPGLYASYFKPAEVLRRG